MKRIDTGMAGYISDRELHRYRMMKDNHADSYIYPLHRTRYRDEPAIDKIIYIVGLIGLICLFSILPAYILWSMCDPANWWMW